MNVNFTIPSRDDCIHQIKINEDNERKRIAKLEKEKKDELQREIDCQVEDVLKIVFNRLSRLFDEDISLADKKVHIGKNYFEFKFFSTTVKYSGSMAISAWHKERIKLVIDEVTSYLKELGYRVECCIGNYCCQGVESPHIDWTMYLYI